MSTSLGARILELLENLENPGFTELEKMCIESISRTVANLEPLNEHQEGALKILEWRWACIKRKTTSKINIDWEH